MQQNVTVQLFIWYCQFHLHLSCGWVDFRHGGSTTHTSQWVVHQGDREALVKIVFLIRIRIFLRGLWVPSVVLPSSSMTFFFASLHWQLFFGSSPYNLFFPRRSTAPNYLHSCSWWIKLFILILSIILSSLLHARRSRCFVLGSRMLNFIVFRCLRRRHLNWYRLSDQHGCGATAGCLGGWGYPSSMGDYENKSLETMDNAGYDGQGMITAHHNCG